MPRRRRHVDPTIDAPLDHAASVANASSSPPRPRKRARRSLDACVRKSYRPRVSHRNHPDSGVGENFHSVPYPLGLMPYSSWHLLHHRRDSDSPEHRFVCPACRKHRLFPSPHRRKLFLTAERLSWEDGTVPTAERELNQELIWEVNFQLGIEAPTLQDSEQVAGGGSSRTNRWFPFENEVDCTAALQLVARVDCLTERSYALWVKMLETVCTGEEHSRPQNAPSQSASGVDMDPSADKHSRLLTPPSSSQPVASQSPAATEYSSSSHLYRDPPSFAKDKPTLRSLPDFYALLDAIERTSYVGAQYLEAYAEQLSHDCCEDCWWRRNIATDNALPS